MKRVMLAGVATLAMMSLVSGAQAADLARRSAMPVKAPMYEAPFSWSGAYVGINGGYGWGSGNNSAPYSTGSFNADGGMVGGTLGYNYQMGRAVFGLETDLDWSGMKGSAACGATSCETNNEWLGTARGRLGYAFDRFLPYVTGGLAYGGVKNSIAGIGSATDTNVGWTVGGGVEYAISGPWSAKVEYLHADLGRAASVAGSDTKFKADMVRGGVNYHF